MVLYSCLHAIQYLKYEEEKTQLHEKIIVHTIQCKTRDETSKYRKLQRENTNPDLKHIIVLLQLERAFQTFEFLSYIFQSRQKRNQ
jgi:hypothetical protein